MPVRDAFLICKMGLVLLAALLLAGSANAYVGPGAGLDLIGYTLTLAAWGLTAISAVMLWPIYAFLRRIRGAKARQEPSATPTPLPPECGDIQGVDAPRSPNS